MRINQRFLKIIKIFGIPLILTLFYIPISYAENAHSILLKPTCDVGFYYQGKHIETKPCANQLNSKDLEELHSQIDLVVKDRVCKKLDLQDSFNLRKWSECIAAQVTNDTKNVDLSDFTSSPIQSKSANIVELTSEELEELSTSIWCKRLNPSLTTTYHCKRPNFEFSDKSITQNSDETENHVNSKGIEELRTTVDLVVKGSVCKEPDVQDGFNLAKWSKCIAARVTSDIKNVDLSDISSNPIPSKTANIVELTSEEAVRISAMVRCKILNQYLATSLGYDCKLPNVDQSAKSISLNLDETDPFHFKDDVYRFYSQTKNWDELSAVEQDALITFMVELSNQIDPVDIEKLRYHYERAAYAYGSNYVVDFFVNQIRLALIFDEKPYGDLLNPVIASLNPRISESFNQNYYFLDSYINEQGTQFGFQNVQRQNYSVGISNTFSLIDFSRRSSREDSDFREQHDNSFRSNIRAASRAELRQDQLNYESSNLRWNSIDPFSKSNARFFAIDGNFINGVSISNNDPGGTLTSSRQGLNRGPANAAHIFAGATVGLLGARLLNEAADNTKSCYVKCGLRFMPSALAQVLAPMPALALYLVATVYDSTKVNKCEADCNADKVAHVKANSYDADYEYQESQAKAAAAQNIYEEQRRATREAERKQRLEAERLAEIQTNQNATQAEKKAAKDAKDEADRDLADKLTQEREAKAIVDTANAEAEEKRIDAEEKKRKADACKTNSEGCTREINPDLVDDDHKSLPEFYFLFGLPEHMLQAIWCNSINCTLVNDGVDGHHDSGTHIHSLDGKRLTTAKKEQTCTKAKCLPDDYFDASGQNGSPRTRDCSQAICIDLKDPPSQVR